MPLALAVKHAGAVPPMRIWVRLGEGGGGGFMYSVKVFNSTQLILYSSVKTVIPGFGNGWLEYCAIMRFWVGQWNILRVTLEI